MEPTLTEIIKTANLKRKALGIEVSEHRYMPQFRSTKNVTMIEGSPYVVEIEDGETRLRPFFDNSTIFAQ